MVKQILSNKFISNIHSQIMRKVQNPKLCKEGEQVITQWKFPGNDIAHAGQIQSTKILPNGNKQVRITTAYGGDASLISMDTRVFSPQGKLINAYHGIRGTEMKYLSPEGELVKHLTPTRAYANESKDIAKIIYQEQQFNPAIKYIPNLPKS